MIIEDPKKRDKAKYLLKSIKHYKFGKARINLLIMLAYLNASLF